MWRKLNAQAFEEDIGCTRSCAGRTEPVNVLWPRSSAFELVQFEGLCTANLPGLRSLLAAHPQRRIPTLRQVAEQSARDV
jgi:hypothetical protein